MQEKTLASSVGGHGLHVCIWEQAAPWCMVQLVHGMSEHIQRYAAFARYLNQQGVLVAGCDNASHGKSRNPEDPWGYFGEKDGWAHLVEDVDRVRQLLQQEHPGVPLVLMGHSMGSFLARSYAAQYGRGVAGFIFMGTAGRNPFLFGGKAIAAWEVRRGRGALPNSTLDKLVAGGYNRPFQPNRTPFDWLSKDTCQVDAYVVDPACGFPFTAAGYRDLFDGLGSISSKSWARQVPDVPILVVSGQEDPVGGKEAKGVKQVANWLTQTGHQVELRIYPGDRHELLNETDKEQVMEDIGSFIKRAVQRREEDL